MYTFDSLLARVSPVPQKAQALSGGPLLLNSNSKFNLTAPTAEFGPVMTAGQRLTAFLQDHCGADCLCEDGIRITLELGQAPADMPNAQEGYELTDEQLAGVSGGWGGKCENQNYCFDDGRNIGE